MPYGHVYRTLIFPFYDKVIKRRNIYNYYRSISGAPWLPIDELLAMQRRKLNEMLVNCYENVPFYRDLFDKRGLDVSGVDDVGILREHGIFTSKEIVRSAGDAILSREYDKGKLHDSATSGSTGNPVYFYMSLDNWCLRMALKYRSEDWMGKPIGTPAAMLWGHFPNMSTFERVKYSLYWRFQNYLFLSAFHIGEEDLIRYVRAIKRHRIRFIESYVTAVYLMARAVEKHGITPPRLDGVIIGAERLFDYQKEKIEGVFGCPVYNRYGSTEFSNVASECTEREGLHINIDNFCVEVVDQDDRPLLGEVGDLVITDLNNFAMPLIRYRIGDKGIMTDRACRCGRTFPMLKDVVGRVSETLKTKDGKEFHDMYFLWKLSRAPGLVKFQVVQKSLEQILVKIEHDGSVGREETSDFIRNALDELDQHGISTTIEYVDKIPLTRVGKMRSFISEIPGTGEGSEV
ncbi:MAG: phenylacetate--CoA ligase family protein [bacterium]|nr:MAG: phenylacetate--CoA ligase family protein [bacterium]